MDSEERKRLEKRIKVLERKLARAEQKQVYAEEQRSLGQRLYRKLQTDLQNMQEQLIHAEKHAALGQLTAGIAHEIKNPLNFINNFAEVNEELATEILEDLRAYREQLPSELFESLTSLLHDIAKNSTAISQYGIRADGIVKGMMEHAGRAGSDREVVDFNDLVSRYAALASDRNRNKGIDFESILAFDLANDLPEISLVPAEIGKVIVSLLDNACDALLDHENPAITVSTERQGRKMLLTIADNGPGIPESVRGKIFEPFFTTKPTGSGTGLGLSLAHDIVKQGHNGELTFQGQENNPGTVFIMTLPL